MCRNFPHITLGKPIFHPGHFSIQIQAGTCLTPAAKTWFTKIGSRKFQTNIPSECHRQNPQASCPYTFFSSLFKISHFFSFTVLFSFFSYTRWQFSSILIAVFRIVGGSHSKDSKNRLRSWRSNTNISEMKNKSWKTKIWKTTFRNLTSRSQVCICFVVAFHSGAFNKRVFKIFSTNERILSELVWIEANRSEFRSNQCL